tara:strand:+ start:2555 stop:4759 length:2205 start_codon:yes stop_codon:yes gene_type:complete
MPFASSTSSGINFLDATISDKSDAHTNSVSVNENQTIIASSHSTFIEFHNSSTLELIKRFDLSKELYDIEFSPDGKYLAASMSANEAIPDSLIVVDVENLDVLSGQARGNNRPGNIGYSPDGAKIIAPNMNNGAQILNSITMNEITRLNGEHTSDVTCTGFSKTGNYVITGDESGKVMLWSSDGEPTNIDLDVGEEIVGCDFSTSDAKFAISTITGNIFSFSLAGSELQSVDLGENHGVTWSTSEDILYVLESDSNPAVIALDGSTFEIIHITHLMHKSLDFEIVESNGMLNSIFVATDSNHIAIYGTPEYPEGYGMIGSDLDGDKIPDAMDQDDDGDSFEDDYDFNCLNSTVCSRDPDLETVRSMIIEISGGTLMIEDIYTMSQSETYLFRNLTRRGIISDQRISYEETNMLEDAFCNNMDQNDYIQKLRSSIELSVGQVNNGTLQCNIITGLSFTKTYDKEQLKFAIKTSFDVHPNVTLPLTVSLNSQISVIESSITHKMENHPILIQHINTDEKVFYSLWWNTGDSETPLLNFTSYDLDDSNIGSVIDLLLENYLLIILAATSIVLSLWVLIRRKNLNSLILDESEFEGANEIDDDLDAQEEISNENFEPDIEDHSRPIPIDEYDYLSDDYEAGSIVSESIPAEEKPTDRRAFTLDDEMTSSESTVKRRAGRMNRNAQGPIMSTKRKRLDGKLDIPGEQKVSKKKTISSVKTRKVAGTKKVRKVKSVKKDD